jgi:hypothetical protein
MSGVETTRKLKQISLCIQILMLSSYYKDEQIFPAILAVAHSFSCKTQAPRNLRMLNAASRTCPAVPPIPTFRSVPLQRPFSDPFSRTLLLIASHHGETEIALATESVFCLFPTSR